MLTHLLDGPAKERLNRIAISKPAEAQAVENLIIQVRHSMHSMENIITQGRHSRETPGGGPGQGPFSLAAWGTPFPLLDVGSAGLLSFPHPTSLPAFLSPRPAPQMAEQGQIKERISEQNLMGMLQNINEVNKYQRFEQDDSSGDEA